jgi:thiamine biosynthesis protein ThiS
MILVNDREEIPWQEGMTVTDLLKACRYIPVKIAVFVDGEFVRPPFYDTYVIEDRATVRVLHLIAGG